MGCWLALFLQRRERYSFPILVSGNLMQGRFHA